MRPFVPALLPHNQDDGLDLRSMRRPGLNFGVGRYDQLRMQIDVGRNGKHPSYWEYPVDQIRDRNNKQLIGEPR
jgi:hypothetical protein